MKHMNIYTKFLFHIYFLPVFTEQAVLTNHCTATLEQSSEVSLLGTPGGLCDVILMFMKNMLKRT